MPDDVGRFGGLPEEVRATIEAQARDQARKDFAASVGQQPPRLPGDEGLSPMDPRFFLQPNGAKPGAKNIMAHVIDQRYGPPGIDGPVKPGDAPPSRPVEGQPERPSAYRSRKQFDSSPGVHPQHGMPPGMFGGMPAQAAPQHGFPQPAAGAGFPGFPGGSLHGHGMPPHGGVFPPHGMPAGGGGGFPGSFGMPGAAFGAQYGHPGAPQGCPAPETASVPELLSLLSRVTVELQVRLGGAAFPPKHAQASGFPGQFGAGMPPPTNRMPWQQHRVPQAAPAAHRSPVNREPAAGGAEHGRPSPPSEGEDAGAERNRVAEAIRMAAEDSAAAERSAAGGRTGLPAGLGAAAGTMGASAGTAGGAVAPGGEDALTKALESALMSMLTQGGGEGAAGKGAGGEGGAAAALGLSASDLESRVMDELMAALRPGQQAGASGAGGETAAAGAGEAGSGGEAGAGEDGAGREEL